MPKKQPDPEQPRVAIDAAPEGPTGEQRRALTVKYHDAVVAAVEAIQRVATVIRPTDQGEIDKVARASACVARSLREMQPLTQFGTQGPADDTDDDQIPLDIDEFRDALAARIRGIIEARRARGLQPHERLEPGELERIKREARRSERPGRPDGFDGEYGVE